VLLAGSLPASAATTTGSGELASETRAVSDFQGISVSGSIDLKVRQAAREAVEVHADDNLLPLLESSIEIGAGGRTLHIRWKRGESIRTRSGATVTVDVVRLGAISSSGSGDVTVDGLSTPALVLSLSGSGDAVLNGLATEDLSVRIAGSGDVSGNGSATRLRLSIAGTGDIQFGGLRAEDVSIGITGSGDAAVQARKTLNVSIAGSGDVVYSGEPAVKLSVAGSGSVKKQ
jgi:hypothetical protein